MKSDLTVTSRVAAIAVSALLIGAAARPAGACSAQLDALRSQWNDFSPPSKPNQARVVGRSGREMTGGQYTYLYSQMRHAARDCQSGQTASAQQRAGHARGVLARAAGRGPDAPERFVGSAYPYRYAD